MTDKINLTQLRQQAETRRNVEKDCDLGLDDDLAATGKPCEDCLLEREWATELLALLDTAEAAIAYTNERATKQRNYWTNFDRLRATLDRYTTE